LRGKNTQYSLFYFLKRFGQEKHHCRDSFNSKEKILQEKISQGTHQTKLEQQTDVLF
jgi:hypothetical protein